MILAAVLLLSSSAAVADVGCPHRIGKAQQPLAAAANKRTVERFHNAMNRQDWTTMESLVAPGYRHFVPDASGFRALDWASFKRGNAHVRAAFPDWQNMIVQAVAEGDKVAVLLQGRGTHRKSIGNEAATGKTAVLPIMIIHQLCGGKLVADWEMTDTGPMMRSLSTR